MIKLKRERIPEHIAKMRYIEKNESPLNIPYVELYGVINPVNCIECDQKCFLCKNAIQRYIIIEFDLLNIKDYTEFVEFQNRSLACINYEIISDLKYSIYLLCIVNDYLNEDKDLIEAIESDMKYMRKKFFTEEDLYKYVNNCLENNPIKLSNKKYGDIYNQWLDILQKNDLYSLMPFQRRQDLEPFTMEIKERKKTIKNIIERFKSGVEYIETIYIDNFHPSSFEKNIKINTSSLNIIYGGNGMGKTSILEAIEFSLTGKNGNILNPEGTAQIDFGKEKVVSSNDEIIHLLLGEFWYNNQYAKIEDELQNIENNHLSENSVNDKFNIFYHIDYDTIQNYISNYKDQEFSEEYILSILNSPTFLELSSNISKTKDTIDNILRFQDKIFITVIICAIIEVRCQSYNLGVLKYKLNTP